MSFYNGHSCIAFYDKDDETLLFIVDNIKELCMRLNWPLTRQNLNKLQVNIFRSVRRENHQTNLFKGKCYHVYLIDMDEQEESK